MEAKLQSNGDILLHFGVKGMRWGVRKSRSQRAADRRARKIKSAERKVAKVKARDQKSLTKVGLASRGINKRVNLRKNATRELDAKIRYLKKDPKRNADKIREYRNLKGDYQTLNALAYNRLDANRRNVKIAKTLATVGGAAMTVPGIRKDVQRGATKGYYKLKKKILSYKG